MLPRASSDNSRLSPDIIAVIVICIILLLLVGMIGIFIRGKLLCCRSYTPERRPRYLFNPRALTWNTFALPNEDDSTQAAPQGDGLPRYTYHTEPIALPPLSAPIVSSRTTKVSPSRTVQPCAPLGEPVLPPYNEALQDGAPKLLQDKWNALHFMKFFIIRLGIMKKEIVNTPKM